MAKIDKAVILAAGRGTRMRELTNELPKPMLEVRGKPVLQHMVEGLRDANVHELLIIVGYRAETVSNFFGDGSRYGIHIQYATQAVQDGTGRVVDLARNFAATFPFVLIYGDILVDTANYKLLVELPDDTEAVVSVKRGEDVSKGGAVFLNDQNEVLDLREKISSATFQVANPEKGQVEDLPHKEPTTPWYNAGLYAFRPSILEFTARLKPSPRGEYELTDAVRDLARSGKKVKALELVGQWADVRDPEILARLNRLE